MGQVDLERWEDVGSVWHEQCAIVNGTGLEPLTLL